MKRQLYLDCEGVLADDQLRHAHLWEEAGGVVIHHKSVEDTLERPRGCFDL